MFDLPNAAAGALVGALLSFTATFGYVSWVTIPAAKEAATTAENSRWQTLMDAEKAKADAEKAKKQAEINAAEAEYVRRQAENSAQIAALNQALDLEKDDAPQVPSSACAPALPRRLSIPLNDVGRPAPAAKRPGVDPGRVR